MLYLFRALWSLFLSIISSETADEAEVRRILLNGALHELPHAPPCPLEYSSALFAYKDPRVRALVWAIKYRNRTDFIRLTALYLYEVILEELAERHIFEKDPGKILLVPVPMSPARRAARGFNQTEILAKHVLVHDNEGRFGYAAHVILRVKDIPRQTTGSKRDREINIRNAFSVSCPQEISGKTVYILDDVITTGSTIQEIARILRNAGAREVRAVAIAH